MKFKITIEAELTEEFLVGHGDYIQKQIKEHLTFTAMMKAWIGTDEPFHGIGKHALKIEKLEVEHISGHDHIE